MKVNKRNKKYSMLSRIERLGKILVKNLETYGNVLGISMIRLNDWCNHLQIPSRGQYLLYTSHTYQIIPYVKKLIMVMNKVLSNDFLFRIVYNLDKVGKSLIPDKKLKEKTRNILRKVYRVLSTAGLDLAYLHTYEPYSGVLLHDLGFEKEFQEHVRKVVRIFKKFHVRKVITIDPHTYYILNDVYPRYDVCDFEVYSIYDIIDKYIDKIRTSPIRRLDTKFAIQKSCIYSRYSMIMLKIKRILEELNVNYVEKDYEQYTCCGGYMHLIINDLSNRIAIERLNILKQYSRNILTLCPICMLNFSTNYDSAYIYDLIETL